MNTIKRFVLVVLVCVLSPVILMGVGQGEKETSGETTSDHTETTAVNANVNPKGIFPIVKTATQLVIGMVQDPKVNDLETNEFTKYLEDNTGIEIVFENLPVKDTTSKVNLMFASDDLPEIFLGSGIMSNAMLVDYGSQGLILPLNDLIEEYGDEIYRMWGIAIDKTLKKRMTMADGNIYSLPKYNEQTSSVYTNSMWIYKPWLEYLNIEAPETTEEFYAMLKAFKTGDPNQNGKADEIPLVGYNYDHETDVYTFILNSFIYTGIDNRFTVSNGKVDVAFTKPEFKEGLMYLNKVSNEGLLDPLTFTQDRQQMKALCNQDPVVIGSFHSDTKSRLFDVASQLSKDYIAIPPLKGPKGIQYTVASPSTIRNAYVITKDCKSPAAAYRFGDFMLSEEASVTGRFGFKGRDWVTPDSKVLGVNGKPAYMEMVVNVWGLSNHNVHWHFPGPGFLPSHVVDGRAWDGDPYEYVYYMYKIAIELYQGKEPEEHVPEDLSMTLEEMDEYSRLSAEINAYVDENITRFITGDRDLNTWDAYLSEFEKMDLDKLINIVQTAYTRANK